MGARDVGEADRTVVFYTKDFGKIIALAKGVRLEKSKLKGHLGFLEHCRCMITPAREWYRLLDAEIIREFHYKDYVRFRNMVLFASFASNLIAGEEKDAKLWEFLKATVYQGLADDAMLIASKETLLNIFGMMPESGARSEEAIADILEANHMV